MSNIKEKFQSCLLGGAIGDAMGYPVEFMTRNEIYNKYGANGLTDLICNAASGKAIISDDTQMTLFTAEGILWAHMRGCSKGICSFPACVFYSYQRWLFTQTGRTASNEYEWILDNNNLDYKSNLLSRQELFQRRAPGNTCLSALSSAINQNYGTIQNHINNSKGCGGIMRVAPAGLYFYKSPKQAFHTACEFAAITHGHPSGYLSAGVLAYIIAEIINGLNIKQAALASVAILKTYDGHEECLEILKKALELAEQETEPNDAVDILGEGWVGEEALAIALYCALKYQNDFRSALSIAVNHSGDSDSTGAICGNIIGAYLGVNGIPEEWINRLELADVIIDISDDLFNAIAT